MGRNEKKLYIFQLIIFFNFFATLMIRAMILNIALRRQNKVDNSADNTQLNLDVNASDAGPLFDKKHLPKNEGVLPNQEIRNLVGRKFINVNNGRPIVDDQYQPASIDLRLGIKGYRVRASFLTGPNQTVAQQLEQLAMHELCMDQEPVLEVNCVYVIELEETLNLPNSISAFANPKSSTGRLDVFTRLMTDQGEIFDQVKPGYNGKLYLEVSPLTFAVKVRRGSRLNQLRFTKHNPGKVKFFDKLGISDRELIKVHEEHTLANLDDILPNVRDGLNTRVDLKGIDGTGIIGYRAQRHTDIIDVDKPGNYKKEDFWEPIKARPDGRLILDPGEFYILVSKEALHIPIQYAAEMVPIDPMMGEFRAHYAGFFDPGFGAESAGGKGSRAVLEVRSHDIPFVLEDGQIIARLIYEPLTEIPETIYGADLKSNYQAQGLKLSKHFV